MYYNAPPSNESADLAYDLVSRSAKELYLEALNRYLFLGLMIWAPLLISSAINALTR